MGSHHPIRKTVTPEPVAIPDKLYFRIGDVARLCDVAPYVLRFWETEFPQLKPNKGGTGQRLYRKKDVEMALRIKSLLYEQGYTIPGARQILKTGIAPVEQPAPASLSSESITKAGAPHLASEMWAGKNAGKTEAYDRGAELRLRAQLAELRDELQALLEQLSPAQTSEMTEQLAASPETAKPLAPMPDAKPRLRLMLEPRPAAKTAAQTTLHLTSQGDLFGAS